MGARLRAPARASAVKAGATALDEGPEVGAGQRGAPAFRRSERRRECRLLSSFGTEAATLRRLARPPDESLHFRSEAVMSVGLNWRLAVAARRQRGSPSSAGPNTWSLSKPSVPTAQRARSLLRECGVALLVLPSFIASLTARMTDARAGARARRRSRLVPASPGSTFWPGWTLSVVAQALQGGQTGDGDGCRLFEM